MKELPNNLATPIDVSHLRKIVRQEKSNKSRREKRKDGGCASAGGDGETTKQLQQQELEIHIPQRGNDFVSIVFSKQDFQEGK